MKNAFLMIVHEYKTFSTAANLGDGDRSNGASLKEPPMLSMSMTMMSEWPSSMSWSTKVVRWHEQQVVYNANSRVSCNYEIWKYSEPRAKVFYLNQLMSLLRTFLLVAVVLYAIDYAIDVPLDTKGDHAPYLRHLQKVSLVYDCDY